MKPTLQVTSDFTKDFNRIVRGFKNDEILVGVPEVTTERNGLKEGPINNATILAINEFGSPANNIPARPVLKIGIQNAQEDIAVQFKLAAQDALKIGLSALPKYYERAGIIAANSVKKAINDQSGIEPPSEATIAAREARGFKGTKALLVTGQLRNSITSVVRRKPK